MASYATCKSTAAMVRGINKRASSRPAVRHLHSRLSTVVRVASPDIAGPPGDGLEWEVPVSERRRLEQELRAARAASERLPAEMRFSREQLFFFGPAEVLTYLRYILAYEFQLDVDRVSPATTLVSLCGAEDGSEAQAADIGRLVAAVDTAFHAYYPLLTQLDWAAATVQGLADAICNDLAAEWN
ncbi:hypothetical protein HYH02_004703 [Chlamydomonas schloesseri]|uniref:Uncharacterized protein n=1 Tax=Chlamydomonas schloesseri TaxID=2026947 RepID=A0A835WQL3_9CHLO|nr:hypothetical protein HYH02_004703 [Chlamydomonas schloesseri]|eukprot:KAG2450870.1 hypothetical protein HYH02_004703 [Chlamydomonas schloesseri]